MIKKQNYYSSFIKNNKYNNNKNYIIVDITVADCQIRAAKPADPFQSDPMPHGDAEKAIWWNNQLVDLAGRINHRQYGYLTRKALRQASRIVDPFLLLVKT
ncbi:MAG: hypothetical protein WCA39_09360 [Nitrososphaeraceae archaeon]